LSVSIHKMGIAHLEVMVSADGCEAP